LREAFALALRPPRFEGAVSVADWGRLCAHRPKDNPQSAPPTVPLELLGGDPELYEVNVFDYVALATSAIAIVLSVLLVPKERIALRVVSIILASVSTLAALGWIVVNGF